MFETEEDTLETTQHIFDALRYDEDWDSLVINRRKPHTHRLFKTLPGGSRLCLHRFFACKEDEAFFHPHPWEACFIVCSGGYFNHIGVSKDRFSEPDYYERFNCVSGSSYTMKNPLTWHKIVPYATTYTVMVNGVPFKEDVAHTAVRTTRGKDLDKLSNKEVQVMLEIFRGFFSISS